METKSPLLVAVDFSSLTAKTVDYAVALAAGGGRRIDLLHVAQTALPAHAARHAPPEVLKAIKEDEETTANESLKALMATVPDSHRGHCLLRRGPAAETICNVSGEGYELVVVSTHGRTGLSHILIGSVAERVVRRAPVPVLVVR
jgi:universal stress protein A